jgi:hypothetical protein
MAPAPAELAPTTSSRHSADWGLSSRLIIQAFRTKVDRELTQLVGVCHAQRVRGRGAAYHLTGGVNAVHPKTRLRVSKPIVVTVCICP